jgi:hypothetical protein
MSNTDASRPTTITPATPLLWDQRRPLAPAIVEQYAGTDTERDIK